MQAIQDIFGLWKSIGDMATAINRKYDTVLAWKLRGRIPEDAWDDVSAAAHRIGKTVSAEQIRQLNTPMRRRGRPANIKRRAKRVALA